jgi:radical SAM/Cys-rich protein
MLSGSSPHQTGSASPRADRQVELLENTDCGISKFSQTLSRLGRHPLRPSETEILQVNTGYLCNLVCSHCHVDAGPDRHELMTRETMRLCVDALKDNPFGTIDITGGAPEMNPEFLWFVSTVRQARPDIKILVRTNLTILSSGGKYHDYPGFLKDHRVSLIASIPCHTQEPVDRQRGEGVFRRSIETLQLLNSIGYGAGNGNPELNLVVNPEGPSLPGNQSVLEKEFREHLDNKFGITFSNLYTITNMPVSRFLNTLVDTGRFCDCMALLARSFNPAAVDSLMCRNTLSVGWDGRLYDCDFNQMLELTVEPPAPRHIGQFDREKLLRRTIVTGQHCYGCTAGAGSSCQGCLL